MKSDSVLRSKIFFDDRRERGTGWNSEIWKLARPYAERAGQKALPLLSNLLRKSLDRGSEKLVSTIVDQLQPRAHNAVSRLESFLGSHFKLPGHQTGHGMMRSKGLYLAGRGKSRSRSRSKSRGRGRKMSSSRSRSRSSSMSRSRSPKRKGGRSKKSSNNEKKKILKMLNKRKGTLFN